MAALSLAFGLTVVLSGLGHAECTHQGRAPSAIVVPPESSTQSVACSGTQQVSIGSARASSATVLECPIWTTTGVSYHPIVAALWKRVPDTQEVHNYRDDWRCSRKTVLGGLLYRRVDCVAVRRTEIETQLHALTEAACPDQPGA